jgi:hypothetical protein
VASAVPFRRTSSTLSPEIREALPHNPDAERVLLEAILIDNALLKKVRPIVRAEDFFTPSKSALSDNGRIFLAMIALNDEQTPIELISLKDYLKADQVLTAYIASLASGSARVSNIEYYAEMIREKSLLRLLIHKTDDLQQKAIQNNTKPAELISDFELFTKETGHRGRLDHTGTDLLDLLMMDLPPRSYVLDPILPVKAIAEVYAWRGSGKTFITMEMAVCIASGLPTCFDVWSIPEKRPVLYVDGEMNREDLQERAQQIAKGHGMRLPDRGDLRWIAADLEEVPPQIVTADGRRRIEDHLRGGELIILDNLSTLQYTGTERETEEWAVTQDWLLSLRRRGFTSIFLHHAGKDGKQRGTSNREDVVNLVLGLRKPADYSQDEGLRCEVYFEKVRGKATGPAVQPFELKLETDEKGCSWLRRPLKQIIAQRAFQMLAAGMRPNDIADDLHMSRWQVYRLKKKYDADPLAPADED